MISFLKTIKNNKLYYPSHFKKFASDNLKLVGKSRSIDISLKDTFSWIEESFKATGDGGSSAYYRFSNGWKGSYPETTGYLIPTLYDYGKYSGDVKYNSLAKNASDWLLSIQSKEGGWQGLQIDDACDLRIFNSGMILDGLIRAYVEEGDEKYLESAKKGMYWILSKTDNNNLFSLNNVVGGGTFDTLVCACLLMVIQYLDDDERTNLETKLKSILNKHLELQTDNYWFKNCNFKNDGTALLHHLGYTIDGLLISAELLDDDYFYQCAKKSARKLLSKFEVNQNLSAYLYEDWTFKNDLGNGYSMCLTGLSQIAIVFQKISSKENDERYRSAALKINDIVSCISNHKSNNKGISYGLAGSYPVNGNYQSFQIVNWAAKYHAESLLLSQNASAAKKKL